MSQAKIFEENIFGGGGGGDNNSLEREQKNNKRKSRRNRPVGRETKRKLSIKFYGVPKAGVR